MFQPRHLQTALALAFGLLLVGCGGASSAVDEVVTEFDGNPNAGPAPIVITTTTVPAGKPGVTYPVTTLTAHGAAGSLSWRISEGTLPPGIWLTSDGRLLGTPASEGLFEFTAQADDGTFTAEQDLAIAVGTFGVRATNGLMFGDAWSGRTVLLRCAGQEGTVSFTEAANRSGGRFQQIDGDEGSALWLPGPTPGTDILEVRDAATGETAELALNVVIDPTETHAARFDGHDVWFLDWNAKTGAHPFATDLRAAAAHLGLRAAQGFGVGESEADRLAELLIQVEILRELNPMFLRNADGTMGATGLPISFAFERPGAGFVAPAANTFMSGRANGYSVMALCEQQGRAAMGVAFGDTIGNHNHEHNAPGGSYGDLGVFVNFVSGTVGNVFRLHGTTLQDAPIGAEDIDALKALLHGLPNPGGRYDVIRYQLNAFAKSIAYIAAHEIGHSLGLAHTGAYTADAIMNSTAIIGPGMDPHFTAENLQILRAGLPGPGRAGLAAMQVAGVAVAALAMAPGGMHVCGHCDDE